MTKEKTNYVRIVINKSKGYQQQNNK